MEMDQLYTELILEHNQDKRNKHELAHFTNSEHGHNPSCGDDLTLQLNVDDGIIKDAAYTGSGCAISQASSDSVVSVSVSSAFSVGEDGVPVITFFAA